MEFLFQLPANAESLGTLKLPPCGISLYLKSTFPFSLMYIFGSPQLSVPFTPRLAANVHLAERRGSKRDEGALGRKTYGAREEGGIEGAGRETGGKEGEAGRGEERSSPGSSYFLGAQRSLYGQAIFMTKPPGRAEVTRKVTRCFRHVTRRYSHSSLGK